MQKLSIVFTENEHEAHTLVLNLCVGQAPFLSRLPANPDKKVLGSHALPVKPLKSLKNKKQRK
jgi:hypothetical protein